MTTMSDPGTAGPRPGFNSTPNSPRALRRSTGDRIISGVAGGLGEYFGVDAVIFRVLFAVLSFFGGVGLLAYGLAWLLIPEPGVGVSALDRAVHQLRLRRVPPWVVIFGGAVLAWLTWFSWWAPGPTFPAIMLLAVVAVILLHRLGNRPSEPAPPPPWLATPPPTTTQAPATPPPATPPPTVPPLWPQPAEAGDQDRADAPQPTDANADVEPVVPFDAPAVPFDVPAGQPTRQFDWQQPGYSGAPAAPLIPPLNDTRRSMQAWLTEAGEAHRRRVSRRRPIKIAVGLALVAGWAIVALLDAFTRVPFPAYLWVGLIVLGAGLLASL
ncbi:MAG: PspC domain-containing protein, partial [Jatrophihabitantaceae bacterium]